MYDSIEDIGNTSQSMDGFLNEESNSYSTQMAGPTNCYCGKDRNLELIDFQCARCLRWFHQNCITINLGRVVQFMTSYTFVCKNCSPTQVESFAKRNASMFLWSFILKQMTYFYFQNRFLTNMSNSASESDKETFGRKQVCFLQGQGHHTIHRGSLGRALRSFEAGEEHLAYDSVQNAGEG